MMQGVLDFLMGDSVIAAELRDRIIFHIVPMLNPDGVIHETTAAIIGLTKPSGPTPLLQQHQPL